MKNVFFLLFILSLLPFASASDKKCNEPSKISISPKFNFEWNKDSEFTLVGTIEFPKTVSTSDAFLKYFLSEQVVTSITHSKAGVKTLGQTFNGNKEPIELPEVGKVVPFQVSAQKCKLFFICLSGKMESNCKFTEKSTARTVLECAGVPNDNMKSHSSKISCVGGNNTSTRCDFELKGKPGSKRYALGGSAESLYNFYGLVYRSVENKFTEEGYEKTCAPMIIHRFYKSLMDDSDKNSFSRK